MNWDLKILGANSAVPTLHRYPSGQVLQAGNKHILIDCGEGSQLRMMEYAVKKSRISLILISHMHGDHIYGLPGLLTSYNLFHRKDPLLVIGPVGIKSFVEQMMGFTGHEFNYPLEVVEISVTSSEVVFEEEGISVTAFPLVHRIPTFGFKITEKITRKYLNKEKITTLGLSHHEIQQVLEGGSILVNGVTYTLEDLERIRLPRSYAYVSDTAFFSECAEFVAGSTFLYHESTFLEEDSVLAKERFHSTAQEAALIAKKAVARHLLLGHYSSRYLDLEKFREEAKMIFPSVFLALSGKKFLISSEGEITENEDILSKKAPSRGE